MEIDVRELPKYQAGHNSAKPLVVSLTKLISVAHFVI